MALSKLLFVSILAVVIGSRLVFSTESSFSAVDVARVCEENNLVPLTVVLPDEGVDAEVTDLVRSLMITKIMFRVTTLRKVAERKEALLMDKYIMLLKCSMNRWWESESGSVIWQILQRVRIGHAVLILKGSKCGVEAPPAANALFYLLDQSMNRWHKVLLMKSSPNSNLKQLKFHKLNERRAVMVPDFDLSNISVTALGIDLQDQVFFKNCSLSTDLCTAGGYTWDLLVTMSKMLNLKVSVYRDPTENWGAIPKMTRNGSAIDASSVFGRVALGEKDIGLSVWMMTAFRAYFAEIAVFSQYKSILVFFPHSQTLDTSFLLHPFDPSVHLVILVVVVLFFLALAFQRAMLLRTSAVRLQSMTRSILTTSGFFFVIINAYYGGALTMFATQDRELPFSNLREAVDAYPEWRLITLPGLEGLLSFTNFRIGGDQAKFHEQMESEQMLVDSLEEAIVMSTNGKFILFLADRDLSQVIKLLPAGHEKLIAIAAGPVTTPGGFLLSPNSPLTPALEWAALQFMETGQDKRFRLNQAQLSSDQSDFRPVQLDQVIVAVGIVFFGVLGAAIFLLVEHSLRYLKGRR